MLYILLCEGERYYIGKTDRPLENRIEEHFSKNGSYWTKKYKPLSVVEVIENVDDLDEDKYTKKYMSIYGINKVRGGTYSEITLPKYKKKCLMDELCTKDDLCFRCKRKGHFVSECYAKTDVNGKNISDDEDDDDEDDDEEDEDEWENINNKKVCERCERIGHRKENCYAKTTVDGINIEVKEGLETVAKVGCWLWNTGRSLFGK
jgi:predicted GIY-YIG superfamily endonuclease